MCWGEEGWLHLRWEFITDCLPETPSLFQNMVHFLCSCLIFDVLHCPNLGLRTYANSEYLIHGSRFFVGTDLQTRCPHPGHFITDQHPAFLLSALCLGCCLSGTDQALWKWLSAFTEQLSCSRHWHLLVFWCGSMNLSFLELVGFLGCVNSYLSSLGKLGHYFFK